MKYSSLDRLSPLRGLAARLRVHHKNKRQFLEQATLSSRQIQIELPLLQNHRPFIDFRVVFENDRVAPSFISARLAFDGVHRETFRLPWIDGALIIENLDWNLADYFLRLDPLNQNKDVNDEYREKVRNDLPSGLKRLQRVGAFVIVSFLFFRLIKHIFIIYFAYRVMMKRKKILIQLYIFI